MNPRNNIIYWKDLTVIAITKLAIHLVINIYSAFGLHRDEYLYLAESDHLSWGFMEVPPGIPFLGWITKSLFGTSDVAVRLFPALAGVLSIYVIGMLVKEIGGKRTAQIVATLGFLLSPVFLGSNNLFQPVSFNQLWWLVIVYLSIKIINTDKSIYWLWLGAASGFAFLTKYSVAFLILALIGGIILSPHMKKLLDKNVIYSIGLASLIASPNIIWQINHDFPVVRHMTDLAATQLVNVSFADFLIPQVLFHFGCSFLWISGLIFIFFDKSFSKYRFLGITYLLVFVLVMSLDGKSYYIYGMYSTLFALGGVAWEKWIGKKALIASLVMLLLNLIVYPYSLPFMSAEGFKSFAANMKEKYGIDAPLRWEDGSIREMTQDFSDMLGWEEIPEKVAKIYHKLSDEEKKTTMIQGGSYGHAGVLNLRRKKYNLPEAVSLNSGFISWAPDTIEFDRQIFVDDRRQLSSQYFENVVLMDSITDPNARDPGYIYYRTGPKVDVRQAWIDIVKEQKRQAGIK